jgi:hypothetical protein
VDDRMNERWLLSPQAIMRRPKGISSFEDARACGNPFIVASTFDRLADRVHGPRRQPLWGKGTPAGETAESGKDSAPPFVGARNDLREAIALMLVFPDNRPRP